MKDLIGQKFNRLTVIGAAGRTKNGAMKWLCRCDCGNVHAVVGLKLKQGTTKSCGCFKSANYLGLRAGKLLAVDAAGRSKDGHQMLRCKCDCGNVVLRSSNNFLRNSQRGIDSHCGCSPTRPGLTHGGRGTPEYRVWGAIKKRCLNPNDKDYPRYGGAGINMAECWQKDFPAFLAEIGPRPTLKHQVDRIDNRRGYEPGNVRWATPTENARNKRTTYLWNIKGESFESSTDAAQRFDVTVHTVIRWTDGFFDSRRGTFAPPRPDCSRRLRYAD